MNPQSDRAGVVGAVLVLGGLALAGAWFLEPALAESKVDPPSRNSPDEPIAASLSLPRAAEFLDAVALDWTRTRQCGTCHTNYAYLLARPALREIEGPAMAEIRSFFEGRASHWDDAMPSSRPRWDTEVVATAAALAIHDAATTGALHPITRAALDRMWTLQRPDGSWDWIKCDWPPYEYDDYYGALFAALGVGSAPDGYARTEAARQGVEKLRGFFKVNEPPNLHHAAFLLWASHNLEGLMSRAQRQTTVERLLALQRPDGGWSLPSLGKWDRRDGTPNDPNAPSDGYATGLVVFVLRQAGLPARGEPIRRGVTWLQTHQRASGRWFTRSLNNDKAHYITNAGTAFAVLALKACDPTEVSREERRPE